MSEWRDSRSRSLRNEHTVGVLIDAFVVYSERDLWEADVRFDLRGDIYSTSHFRGKRFASREDAKSWCERMIAANLPLLEELVQVKT